MKVIKKDSLVYDLEHYQGSRLPTVSDTMFHCIILKEKSIRNI